MIEMPVAAPTVYGHERPRLAPPQPLRSKVDEYVTISHALGIDLMPWQCTAMRYMTALGPDERLLYREVAIVVARQNGKTTLLVPFVVAGLRMGMRIMHTAQNRVLPRDVFEQVAEILGRAGIIKGRPRFANGQEAIKTKNGGIYRIVAPTRGGARGPSNDVVLIDELREMDDFGFIGASKPTLTAARSPQTIYLSNAGTDESVVLNALRLRAQDDPALAYLEWSAAPDRDAGDIEGWRESNPAMGHIPAVQETLTAEYRANMLVGTMGIFETEHLCRWVHTIVPPILKAETWEELRGEVSAPRRPVLGVSLDPNGQRASAALAWQQEDGRVAVRLIADVTGDPVDVPRFGADLRNLARDYKVSAVGYDGATDAELAKYFKKPDAISGAKFTNASSMFVNLAEGRTLVWDGEPITPDIQWTGRKTHEQPGTWTAVKLSDEHPITAMLATIRAVWLASGPKPTRVRVH